MLVDVNIGFIFSEGVMDPSKIRVFEIFTYHQLQLILPDSKSNSCAGVRDVFLGAREQ